MLHQLLMTVGGMNALLLASNRQIDSQVLLGQLCLTWVQKPWPRIYHECSNISFNSWNEDSAVHLEMCCDRIILLAPQD